MVGLAYLLIWGILFLFLLGHFKSKTVNIMEIMITKEALSTGYWFLNEERCREWEKFCVVEIKSKVILLTSTTKIGCEKFIDFINTTGSEVPQEYKKRVNKFWRKK